MLVPETLGDILLWSSMLLAKQQYGNRIPQVAKWLEGASFTNMHSLGASDRVCYHSLHTICMYVFCIYI